MTSRPAYSDIARRRRFAAAALRLRARAVRWELELEDSLALQPEPALEPAPAPEHAPDLPLDDLEWSDADEPPTALPPGSDDESLEDGALGPEPGPTAAVPAPAAGPTVIRGRPSDHRLQGRRLASAVHRRVARGQLRQAARVVLDDSPPVAIDAAVLDRLRELHPFTWSEHAFPRRGAVPHNVDYSAHIRATAGSMALDTAAGPSGWSVGLARIALRSDAVRACLCSHLLAMRRDEAPGRRICCASRLVVLAKPGGSGVRPIAVGEVFYRIFMRTVLTQCGSSVRDGLLPTQFGVRTPGGVEPIIRMVEHAVAGDVPCAQITCLDFSNAYNTLSRNAIASVVYDRYPQFARLARWAYRGPAPLIVDGISEGQYRAIELESREGVRQGDPLAPLLFSAGMRPFLGRLQDALGPGHLVLAYLDDVIVLSERETDVVGVADRAAVDSATGLRLNVNKSKTYSMDMVERSGLRLLGTLIGGVDARREFADQAVASLRDRVARLLQSQLPHQDKWLLLSHSVQQSFRHLMRQLDSTGIEDLWPQLDEIPIKAITELGQIPPTDMDALARSLVALPERFGGLGILSHAHCQRSNVIDVAAQWWHLLSQLSAVLISSRAGHRARK